MRRIYQSNNAGVTYQGSQGSRGFSPVTAPNSTSQYNAYTQSIVERGRAAQRSLDRRQRRATQILTATQEMMANQLKAQGDFELGALRLQQQDDKAFFDIEQKIAEYGLEGEQQYLKDSLKIEQKYQEDSLKLQFQYQNTKAKTDLYNQGQIQQYQNVATNTFNTALKGLLSMSSTYVKEQESIRKQEEVFRQQEALVDSVFGLENDAASVVPDPVPAADIIATENGIQTATDDPNIQQEIRSEVSETALTAQVQRSTVYEAAADFPIFFENWVNDASVTYTRPDGSTFTVNSPNLTRADLQQISMAARRAFYTAALNAGMPKDQIAKTLIPVVLQTDANWQTQTWREITAIQQGDGVRQATIGIEEAMAAGDDLQTIFNNGSAELYGTGAFNSAEGGGLRGANDATVKAMLAYAIRTRNLDLIEAISNIQKVPGQAGTELGRQYAQAFADARTSALRGIRDDSTLTRGAAEAQVQDIIRNNDIRLFEAESPEQEVQINLETAEQLEALDTPESRRAAAQIRSMPNYSPYTALEIAEQQREGRIFTNDDLGALVRNGEITAEEAKGLGWDPQNSGSRQEQDSEWIEQFDNEIEAQARAAALRAIGNSSNLSAEDRRLILESQGEGAMAQFTRELTDRFRLWRLANPTATEQDASKWIIEEGQKLYQYMTFNEGQAAVRGQGNNETKPETFDTLRFEYERGSIRDVQPTTRIPGSQNPNQLARDYRGFTADDLNNPKNASITSTISITGDLILNEQQIRVAQQYIEAGRPLPADIQEIASALGTNADTLLRGQFQLLGMEYPTVQPGVEDFMTQRSQPAQTYNRQASPYDTNETIGSVNLDVLRDSVVAKESTNNPNAVNPDTGALGLAQVLPSNVPSWSRQVLGYSVSAREFLRSPELQMKIVNGMLRKFMQEEAAKGYSGDMLIRRVASRWYSGNPDYYDSTASQGGYPSIRDYTLDVVSRYDGFSQPPASQVVYRTGNRGPTSTGPHLDVKQVGGGRFDLTALDPYVLVNDPEFGMITLSDLRRRTNNVGDSWDEHAARGSHGIDVGTQGGSEVSIRGGARLISQSETEHGNLTVIELPNGKRYSFLHGDAA